MSVRNLMRVMLPLFFVLSVSAYAQIPNASFESWSNADPVGWVTSNAPPLYTNVTASTTAHTGTYSVKGIAVQFYTQVIEPAIQSGPGGRGFPWTQRSGSFSGYYQFFPQGGDRFGINVWLFKNGESGTGVAVAASADSTTRSSWTAFNVPFQYLTGDTPDTCIVQILIAARDTLSPVHAGSYFLLDDIALNPATGVEGPEAALPQTTELGQNYPNPFNPATVIRYTVAAPSPLSLSKSEGPVVSLKVFDLLGREVATLVNEQKAPGTYEVRFDGGKLASGIYLCRMVAGNVAQTRKLVLMK